MLFKLSTGHEINPDRIDWILLYTPEYDFKFVAGAQIGSRMFDLTPEELEILRAYHEGKSVGETLEQIKKRMDQARIMAEEDAKHKRMSEFVESEFCSKCVNGPKRNIGVCNCKYGYVDDQLIELPSGFVPKDPGAQHEKENYSVKIDAQVMFGMEQKYGTNNGVKTTKPFTVQDLPNFKLDREQKAIDVLMNKHIESMRNVCLGCEKSGSELCASCWTLEDFTMIPKNYKPKLPDCSGAQHNKTVERNCCKCANLAQDPCVSCDNELKNFQPRN